MIDHKTVRVCLDIHKYDRLVKVVQNGGNGAPQVTSCPNIGDIVLAFSAKYVCYGRARVYALDDYRQSVEVEFLEFDGRRETVNWHDLRVISDSLRREPYLLNEIILVKLKLRRNAVDSNKIFEYLTHLQENDTPLQLRYAHGSRTSTEKRLPWIYSISGEMFDIATQLAINVSNIAAFIPVFYDVVPCNGFSGSNITVLILNKSLLQYGHVSCIRKEDIGHFLQNSTKVDEYGKKASLYSPFLPFFFFVMQCVGNVFSRNSHTILIDCFIVLLYL